MIYQEMNILHSKGNKNGLLFNKKKNPGPKDVIERNKKVKINC